MKITRDSNGIMKSIRGEIESLINRYILDSYALRQVELRLENLNCSASDKLDEANTATFCKSPSKKSCLLNQTLPDPVSKDDAEKAETREALEKEISE